MKLDDLLELLESDEVDARRTRRKAAYFEQLAIDNARYRNNRKNKYEYDHEYAEDDWHQKPQTAKYDRSKRL